MMLTQTLVINILSGQCGNSDNRGGNYEDHGGGGGGGGFGGGGAGPYGGNGAGGMCLCQSLCAACAYLV